MAGIEAGATADQTPAEIRDGLATLTGEARVDASSIKNLPSGGGGGFTQEQIEQFINTNERVESAHELEARLRRETALVTNASVTVGGGNNPTQIPGRPQVPAADGDREIVVSVASPAARVRFDLTALTGKPAVDLAASPSPTLSTTNAVAFASNDGNTQFFVARGTTGEFLFSADGSGTFSVTITDSVVDVVSSAQADAKIAAYGQPFTTADVTKLAGIEDNATADQTATEIRDDLQGLSGEARLDASAIKNLPGGTPTSNADIDARIADWAEEGNTDPIPEAKRPLATPVADDAFTTRHNELVAGLVTGGWEQQQINGQIDALRQNKLASGSVPTGLAWNQSQFVQGPRVTNWWLPIRVRIAEKDDLANWRVTIDDLGTTLSLANAEHIHDGTSWAYYQIQVADAPSGDTFTIEHYQKVSFDTTKVMFPPDHHATLTRLANRNDGAATGITVTAISGDQRSSLSAYPRNLDLNTHTLGTVLQNGTVTLTTAAPSTLAFSADGAQSANLEGDYFLSSVIAAMAYDGSHRRGVEVAQVPMYAGNPRTQVAVLADHGGEGRQPERRLLPRPRRRHDAHGQLRGEPCCSTPRCSRRTRARRAAAGQPATRRRTG